MLKTMSSLAFIGLCMIILAACGQHIDGLIENGSSQVSVSVPSAVKSLVMERMVMSAAASPHQVVYNTETYKHHASCRCTA